MKTCKTCNEEFEAKSRHANCPPCRTKAARKTCACGASMDRKSTTCANCQPRTSESNPNWRGGGVYHKKGYRMRRVNGKYVMEHILVMEEVLGRSLLPGENVHHKNGVRDDNRPENLELWVTTQPAGQRPEDLVAWAKEILERYN